MIERDPANLKFSCFNLADQNYLITQKVIIDFLKFNLSEIFKTIKYKFLFLYYLQQYGLGNLIHSSSI